VKASTYDPNINKWSNIVSEAYTIDIPAVEYTLSLSVNNQAGGTTGGSGLYAQGNPVTVTANAANGYSFRNWTENGNEVSTSASYSFNMGAFNRTLVANFTAITSSGGGSGGGSPPPAPPALPPVEEPLLPVEIPEAPIVITGSASLVTMSQATLNGQIESIGGKQCKQVNFAYRQKGTSDWLYTTAVSGSFGNGARFSANLSGLKANAVYDYKARAYNTFGWGEGLVYQFTAVPENLPKVSTEAAINLEVAAATLEGTIIGTGGLPITESGFLWGTSLNILKKAKATADLDGSLSFLLSGLKKNTLYYYRAYATNAAGIGYGDFLSFQTLEKPLLVVTTQTATNIGSDAAVINGSYTGGAGANISTAFMLGTETDTGKYSRLATDITNSDGTFSKVLNGLQPNTTYYYQALASNIYNDFTVLPGDFMSFTTLPPNMPEVETKNPSGVTSSSVNLSGIVLKNNGLAVIETGFLWGTDPNPENKVVAPTGSDGRNFSYPLSGLKGGTSYNIKAYASNSVGTGYGKVISFNTPARIPALSTTAADFNADSWQVNFTGNIEDTGGAMLTEYGFRYSTDQQKWIPLIIDRGSLTGRIAAQLNGLNQLPTGIYYVQAYGVNPMGTGYGNTVSFATPVIPKLVASVEGLGFDSAVLIGNITDTGNKGLPCQNIQFQYRPIGETQWQTVGSEQGLFVPGLFRLNLAGLKPGTKYEFIAQAYNPAGWGSSQVVPFFTGWGLTDKDAAFNMKGAGYNSTDTANVLKRDYRDDDVAAFSALEYATFTINDIAVGLRDSDYKESRQALVNLLKSANYEVVPVAMIIKQIFPETPAPSYYFSGGNVFTIPGKADLTYKWAAECLKNAGYGIDEIIKAMKEVFAYKAIDCVNNLQSDKLALQPYAIYGAIARAYGINDLANCIWSIESKELQRGSPIYRPLAGVLNALTKGAGITGLQAATLLKEVYPPTNAPQMAGAYKNAGFTALEAGEALMQIFGTDSQALALALAKNDYGSYGLKEIEDFLFTKMNCTPKEMVQIVTIIARNSMVRAYDEVPRVLTDYYKLDAYAAAKAMYTGGWNEANDGTGYGLTNMIRILNDYYGLKTAGSIIAVLKELGLSPIAVANVVWTKYQNWLSDYREQGYSATDAAAWCKSTGNSYYGNVHSAVSIMAQGKYSLIDIVLGIRNIYEPDAGTALEIFREASSSRQLGWTSSTIASAVSQVYKVDPIPAVIKAMRASGAHVNQTTSTLKDSFAMDDRIKVAEYLSQGGYSENEVLSAFNYVFDKNSSNRQAIESLLMLDDKVFHSKPPNMGAVLSAMGCLNPLGAASLLNKNGYTIKEIAQAIKTSYTVTSFKAIEDMTRALGSDKQKEIMSTVMAVYGLDPVSYIQYRKGMGNNAIQAAESLIAFLGATEPEKLASYLAQAKYEEKDVLSAILKIFYQGAANPDALQMLTKIMQEIYRQNKAIIETILMAAGISSPEAAINVLYQAGYSLDVIVRELKDSYNLTAGEATDLLIRSGYYQQSDINAKIQAIFGGDIVLVSLQYWMSRGYYASSSFRLLADEMGIKDSAKRFDYLLKAGYPENDAWEAVIQNAREDMVYILKENYKLKEPAKIGKQFKSLPILGIYYGVFNVIPQLQRVFPGIKSIDVLKVLFAAELNHREIVGWLRGDQENGLPDDELISILGTAKPDDLGLRTVDAVEIIHGKGYSLKDAAAWLLKDKYTWPDFFGYLVNNYSPGIRGSSASNVSPVLNELKKYYSIDDLASGLIGSLCRMSGRSVPDTQIYANVYREMRDIGLSLEDTVAVLLRTGEKSASALVRIMADDSIGRANAEHNPSLRLSATDIANVLYNTVLKTPGVSISMIDIAAGLGKPGLMPVPLPISPDWKFWEQ
jgi:hypothetical protein